MHGCGHVWHWAASICHRLWEKIVGQLHIQAYWQRRHLLHDSLHAHLAPQASSDGIVQQRLSANVPSNRTAQAKSGAHRST